MLDKVNHIWPLKICGAGEIGSDIYFGIGEPPQIFDKVARSDALVKRYF